MIFRTLLLLPLVAILSVGCAGTLRKVSQPNSSTGGIVLGDTRNFHDGEATSVSLLETRDANFVYGIGIGTTNSNVPQGTAVVWGGNAAIQPVGDPSSNNPVVTNNEFFSSYFFGVSDGSDIVGRYAINAGNKGIPLGEVIASIKPNLGETLVIAGAGDFASVAMNALKQPAENGEIIYGPNYGTFFERNMSAFDTKAIFTAVVHRNPRTLRGSQARIVFTDPDEPIPAVVTQINGAVVNSASIPVVSTRTSEMPEIEVVGRLLPESLIREGEIVVYRVADLEKR